jgi:hypothetical protein
MDQLKVGLQFVWTHRFWFSLGLSVILASLLTWMGVGGSTGLAVRFKRAKDELDQIYTGVSKFASGSHKNNRWVDLANTKEGEVAKEVGTVAELLYKEQAPLFKWPAERGIQKQFGDRPFMADLTDNKRQFLIDFLEEDCYRAEAEKVWRSLAPVEKDEADGAIYGYVDVPPLGTPGSITSIGIADRITTWEAWMAMEELWVQAAIARAIVKANEPAQKMTEPLGVKKWLAARVRKVNAIVIGKVGLDSQNSAKASELKAYDPPAAPAGAAAPAGTSAAAGRANEPNRYLDKTEEFRSIPVFVSLMVEQSMVAEVLAALNQADLGFTSSQVSFFAPEKKVEIPGLLREQGRIGRLSERDDPGFNTYQLDVWGTVRIYEMPKAMKEAWEAKRKEAATGTPANPAAAPPTTPAAAPTTPPANTPPATPPAPDASKSAPPTPPAADAKKPETPPPSDAGKAAPPAGDAGKAAPPADAGKAAGKTADAGKAAPAAGDAGKASAPAGDAGKAAPPSGDAGKAAPPAPPAGDPKKPGN